MMDRKGKSSVLLTQTEQQLREHLEIATEEQAPEEVLSGLAENQTIPYFRTSDGYYCSDSAYFCYAASRLQTSNAYYWALMDAPDFLRFEQEEAFSYDTCLSKLDALGQLTWG